MNERGRRLTRRRVLFGALAGAGAIAAAGTGAVILVRGGDGEPTPSPSNTGPPPTPPPIDIAPQPTAIPQPADLLSFLEPSDSAFERVEFALSDSINWTNGVFFMDTRTGAMRGYRRKGAAQDQVHQVTAAGPRFVLAQNSPDGMSFLLDRTSGQEWRWDGRSWAVVAATESFVVFAESKDYRQTGRYLIARSDLREAVEYNSGVATWARWLAENGRAAVASPGPPGRVTLVDLATGKSTVVFTAPEDVEGMTPSGLEIFPESEDGFAALVQYYRGQPSSQGANGAAAYLRQRISWDGDLIESSVGPAWFESRSPDGKHLVRETYLHWKPHMGEGGGEVWPATELTDAGGRKLLRLRSVALSYGDNLPRDRWLADSSGFVAMVADPGQAPLPASPYRHAVISLNDDIDVLPMPPVGRSEWYTRPTVNGPVPSPHDADILSFGRSCLYNRRTGQWFVPRTTDTSGPAHLYPIDSPWAAGPGEMVFAVGHGGHGGSYAPALVAPLLEQADFPPDQPLRFRVERTKSCLNLREKPDESAAIIACLPEGTLLEFEPAGEILRQGGREGSSYATSASGAWALVNAAGVGRGWVSTAYLAWATDAASLVDDTARA